MLFAVLTNLIRSIFLTLWAYYHGSQAIDEHWVLPLIGDIGTVHDVTGIAILFVTCIGLIILLPIFNYKLKDFEEDEGWNQSEHTARSFSRLRIFLDAILRHFHSLLYPR